MSKYKLSRPELELLKVAKNNQDTSLDLLDESKSLEISMTTDNEAHERYLDDIEKKMGIKPPKYEDKPLVVNHSRPLVPGWEELVLEAETNITLDVDFDDLLTSEEFANAYRHLDEINAQFSKQTELKKIDLVFLTTAIALQCTRQYVIDPWLKNYRAAAGANDENGRKGKAEPGWYYVETEKILINKVPFDTTRYNTASSIQGFLKGGGHRQMTLGHDPILGWVFGTANILTSTLTRNDFASAHIKHQIGKGNVIHSLADSCKVFTACKERLFNEGWDGKLAVGSAIVREAIHLKSDANTKRSLPIPFVSSTSPEFAKELARYGIDTASVSTGITLSALINTLIAMVHRLFYEEGIDQKLFEVRTRKILLYSNLIASTSNVIATVILKNPKILDVGGLVVTIMRLLSDVGFVCKLKQEFVQSALDVHFQGVTDELEQMYEADQGGMDTSFESL
jgi:hypothetical protein